MKALFDTMVHVTRHLNGGKLPEKWVRPWNQCAYGQHLIISELLVTEIYHQIAIKDGYDSASTYILTMKGFKGTMIYPIKEDDNLAMETGRLKVELKTSLVDSHLIAIAKRTGAKIYTTDHHIRDSARKVGCQVDYLPVGEIRKVKG